MEPYTVLGSRVSMALIQTIVIFLASLEGTLIFQYAKMGV